MHSIYCYPIIRFILRVTVITLSIFHSTHGTEHEKAKPECNLEDKALIGFVEDGLGSLGRSAQFDTSIIRGGRSARLFVRDNNGVKPALFFSVLAVPDSIVAARGQTVIPTVTEAKPVRTMIRPAIRGIELLGRETAETGDERTVLTLEVPNLFDHGWRYLFWPTLSYYIAACPADGSAMDANTQKGFVAVVQTKVSSGGFVKLLTFSIVALVYLLAAVGVRRATTPPPSFIQSLNPFRLTAGISGGSSISNLQVFTFSLIVFGLLVYVLLRAGELSDISANVAWLLGIVGVGTSAARITANRREQLSPANLAWLLKRGWLKREPSIAQLITQSGRFSVTRFQSIAFSLVVAIALLVSGPAELATFTIPDSILGLLVASQAIYVSGKWVQPAAVNKERFDELNNKLNELRNLENQLIDEKPADKTMNEYFATDPTPALVKDYKDEAKLVANKLAWEYEVSLPTTGIDGLPLSSSG